jgi:hypothetical protein
MPEQIGAWTRSVELANEIEAWARNIAPVVREVVEIDPAVGMELKRRLCARYAEEHLDAHGLAPSLLQRVYAAILNHVLSEADDAQPQSVEVARARVRAARSSAISAFQTTATKPSTRRCARSKNFGRALSTNGLRMERCPSS